MIVPPPPTAEMRRVRGLAWAVVGVGAGSGFLLGVLLGGGFSAGLEDLSSIIQVLTVAPLLIIGTWAFAWRMGKRVVLPAVLRYGFATAAVAAGLLVGITAAPQVAEEGRDDLSGVIDTLPGITGLVLLALSLAVATVLSFRRFPPSSLPDPVDSLEDAIGL